MPEDMGSVAIAEPVESVGAEETVETSVEGVETGSESIEASDESNSSQEKEGLTPSQPSKTKLNLADVVKKSAEALKAINPALPSALRTAAFELQGLYREFPGGLKEASQIKQVLGEYGGVEGLKETAAALSDYANLESMFEKGDAKFWSIADELPQAFSQIMPAGLEKWKATDPEMYDHVQSKVFVNTLDNANFSQILSQVYKVLDPAKNKSERDALAFLWGMVEGQPDASGNLRGGLREKASKAPERKVNPQEEALTKREQELQAREQKALLSPIANEGRQQIQTITDREMNASYQWNATDPDIKSAVSERVRQEVIKASQKDRGFTQEFDRLKDRGDAQGLSRHIKNFQDRITPQIVQRVAKLFAVKPKGAGPQIVKKPVVAANGKAPEQGWQRISKQPNAKEIDYVAMGRNAEDMLLNNKAILKDKRRVVWN